MKKARSDYIDARRMGMPVNSWSHFSRGIYLVKCRGGADGRVELLSATLAVTGIELGSMKPQNDKLLNDELYKPLRDVFPSANRRRLKSTFGEAIGALHRSQPDLVSEAQFPVEAVIAFNFT